MKTFTTCAEKKAKQFFNLLQGYTKGIRITAILILLLMGVNNAWAWDLPANGYIYFVKPSQWSTAQFMIGHSSYSIGYSMTSISNTRLYYYKTASWGGYGQSGFIDASSTWGGESNAIGNRKTYASHSADVYTSELIYSGNMYGLFTSTYKDTHDTDLSFSRGSSYTICNKTQTIGVRVWDGSAYSAPSTSPATVTASTYNLKSATASQSASTSFTAGATATGTKTVSAAYSATVSLSYSNLANGYTFVGWYDSNDNEVGSSYEVTGTKTVYARFKENTYTVTVTNDGHGTTTPSGAQSNVGQVTGLSIKATPAANYEFVNWTITSGSGSFGSETSASTTFKPTSAATIQANFRSTATNSLTVVAGANIESVTGSTDPVTLGNTYPITATPETGYSFNTWTASPAANATFASATSASTNVTVKNGSVTVTASATEIMSTLTTANHYDNGNPGYDAPEASVSSIGIATTATVTATAAGEGYTFEGWTLTNCTRTDGGATNATTITVRSNGDGEAATVTANYEQIPPTTVYFKPTDSWKEYDAWFAVYYWESSNNGWVSMTNVDCNGDYYTAEVPGGYSNMMFVRLKPSTADGYNSSNSGLHWDNKWEQTYDLSVPTDNNVLYDMASTNITHLYLKPNSNWANNSTRNSAYFYGNGEKWVSMTKEDNETGYYIVEIPSGYPNVIFCSMNKNTSENSWNDKWNQTGNLTIPTNGNNLFTLPDESWDGATTTWSTIYDDSKWTTYTPPTYEITLSPRIGGAITTDPVSPVEVNTEVTVTITPSTGYAFRSGSIKIGTNEATNITQTSSTHTICGPTEITAEFVTAGEQVVYLKPTSKWNNDSPTFAVHVWNNSGDEGARDINMTPADCNGDYYMATIPAGFHSMVFYRKSTDGTTVWNKTADLVIPVNTTNNCYTISSTSTPSEGSWSTYAPPTYDITINAPESGTISVTIDGNTTNVTTEAFTIENVTLNAEMTVAFTGNTGYELGKAIIQVGNNAEANTAGTYQICGPTEITAYFVTEEDQIVYLRPNDNWLADDARFAAYAFNRYAGTDASQWIELTTKENDYTGAFSGTIPAGHSHVIFVRINPEGTSEENNGLNWDNDWNQTINYSIPTDETNNRFIIGEKVISGEDKDKYQGSWEVSDRPIYGIPGDWQNEWAAKDYPLMGPDGEVTVNITQTNDTLGFKVYRYPYGTDEDSRKWLGNNGTMVRGGEAVHEGGWTMSENTNNCGLGVDVAGDYVFHFNIRESKLTVQYPPMPVPSNITLSAQRIFEDAQLDWIAGNGTEANPYQLYVDETARITITGLADVPGLTTCYRVGDNEEQTSNIIDFTNILTEDTAYTVYAYYKNAMGATSDTVTEQTPYIKGLPMPFYLMTSPSQEINIDRIAAGENILVQFRSDAAATVDLYLQINDEEERELLVEITNSISEDYTHVVDDNIEPCILHYIARSAATVHGRTFEAKADVAIYKNVIIKVHDPDGWVKNAYMWRDYSDAVKTQWPGEPVLQNFGTWRVFSVKYPYYDRFIVNDGNAGNSTQTIDWELPADDTCYELLDPADNGSDKEEDKAKYGLKVADCPENLLVEDIKDTTITEGEQIVVMPKIFVGLGYQVADIEASVSYDDPTSIKAMMSGTNVTILGNAEGESNVTVTYILDNIRIEKTFKVTVTKRTKITIQVKVPKEGTSGAVGWTNHDGVYLRYWHTNGENIKMNYLSTVGDYDYYEADVPLDANGETNFHLFYEQIDNDNRWRQTINKTKVKEDGCYRVTQDGGNYYRGLEYDGVRCLTDQYQVRIAMGSGKTYTSNIVTAEEDTLSFFAPGMNETGYKAGVIMLYQNDKMIATIEPSTFAVSNVYTATLNDALNGLDNVSTYSGNFYIRTYGTSHKNVGFNNGKGWNSIKDLTAVEKDSVRFTKFTSREGEFYNHYWVQAMNTGTFDGKDVSACVANEYNDDLAGKLLQDKHTNEYGDIKVGIGKVINVRFGYDPRTNYFGRAILQGSEFDTYLNIHCDNAYRDKDCTPSKKFPYGTSDRDNKMYDISTWVYQRDIYVPIDNSHPSASLYLEATSPSTERTVTDHLLGYVKNDITGEDTSTPIQKQVIGSGTTNGTYLIRVVYDFKTNRLIAAWLPQGTIDVKEDRTLNADVLFVRQENNEVPQIQLAENGKIRSLESLYFAIELLRGDEDSNNRRQEQYWFTLPFDCKVGSISGVPGYMQTWGIQRYRGDLRAQKGWYAETPTFWEWLDTEDVMHAGEGYLLVFDKKNAPFEEIEVDKMDAEGNIIDGQKETISMMRLYFPSMTSGFDLQQQLEDQLTRTYENHTCTLTLHDRYLQDSNWKVIGTTSYNNAGITGYTVDTDPEYEELSDAPNFRYKYDYNWKNGTFNYEYIPEDGKTATYKSFYGYMVQFAGTINWQPIMSETVPEGIAARRYVPANERTSFTTRLEIANAEGEKQDQTFVALDEKATTTFDQNLDLNKVMNSHKANIYTLSENIPFAGNTLPMEKATVPVGVRVATAGEYTFRMPDGTDGISVTLVDNVTGTHTDMLMDEYTITLDAGTIVNRFYLVVDPDRAATSVENIGEEAKGEEAKDQIKKFLIDGQLFIRTADGTFDAKGQRL